MSSIQSASSTQSDNLNHSIINTIHNLKDDSSYETLYDMFIGLNKFKIQSLKKKLDLYVVKMSDPNATIVLMENLSETNKEYINKLRPYLKYILSMLSVSYPNIQKRLKYIVAMLNIIDSIDVYPTIFNPIMINIIHKCFLMDIMANINEGIKLDDEKNQELLGQLKNIPFDVDMLFNMYNETIGIHDLAFNSAEQLISYNDINSLNFYKFDELLSSILTNYDPNKKYLLREKFERLSILISHIEHQSQNDLTEYMSNNIDTDTEFNYSELDTKFLFDINTKDKIDHIYKEFSNNIYSNLRQYKQFEQFNFELKVDDLSKKSLYFWTEYLATINMRLFDIILTA